jgi:elongation factor P--beta-lysine ligase
MKIQTDIQNLEHYKKYLNIEKATEEFLQSRNYLKLNLPLLSPALVPESYLEVFATEFRYFTKSQSLYLTPSPELFIKRLLAYGIGNCYSLGKSFRNSEPDSTLHSPEFTMLEFYRVHAHYLDIADDVLNLLKYLSQSLHGSDDITYQGNTISFTRWEKFSVSQAFVKYAHIGPEDLYNHEVFIQKAKNKGYRAENFSYEDVFSQMYVQEVEPNLGKNGFPTLLYDYPKEFAALAKLNEDGLTAQRFEFYIQGIELGDCYSELTDPVQQASRFDTESQLRSKSGKIEHPVDNGFVEALRHGLPECAGIAIGFDRLAMIFADVEAIEELRLINITE